ncbi:MAG: pyruvate ferredoxin oxidoreductase [Deltaproteobacteria bacterium HGW-Deltaproteobacteria-17]|nr:MAG: pyruvate ferredoxin oxidoreductase [Deltaproteobacteria bacterium HGW-Deltaproteobacteria-17]
MTHTTQIYMIGVGGQGIGLLSEVLAHAGDLAGLEIRAVDTHGLAQRGGSVESFLRVGTRVFSPLVAPHDADLVIALERTEALRGLVHYARRGGRLVWYETTWQPLAVRLGREPLVETAQILERARALDVTAYPVHVDGLPDPRMQNVAVLATIAGLGWIPGVGVDHFRRALTDLVPPKAAAANLALFDAVSSALPSPVDPAK